MRLLVLLMITLGFVVAFGIANAQSQTTCMSQEEAEAIVSQSSLDLEYVAVVEQGDGLIKVYTNKEGRWVVLRVNEYRTHCYVLSGEGWKKIEPKGNDS